MQRYQYRILQEGALPLRPDGEMDLARRHQCSALLIWPEAQMPEPANTVLTDPCFTRQGFVPVAAMLAELDVTFQAIGHVFISHHHGDHLPRAPEKATERALFLLNPGHDPYGWCVDGGVGTRCGILNKV